MGLLCGFPLSVIFTRVKARLNFISTYKLLRWVSAAQGRCKVLRWSWARALQRRRWRESCHLQHESRGVAWSQGCEHQCPARLWKMPLLQQLSPLTALGVPAPCGGGEVLHLPRQGQSREEKTYLMQKLLQASGRREAPSLLLAHLPSALQAGILQPMTI